MMKILALNQSLVMITSFIVTLPRNNWQSTAFSQRSASFLSASLQNRALKRQSTLLFSSDTMENGDSNADQIISPVRVVTFDLDNTLWNTGKVINFANDALAEFLESKNLDIPLRAEKTMGKLFTADKSRYAPLTKVEDIRGPVLLTQLRKDAVMHLLQEYNGYTNEDSEMFAEEAFKAWTTARHDAIPPNFACDVIETMKAIRQLRMPSGEPIVIGAITDGNSDPLQVPELEEFFDFVVQAEKVGCAKPDIRVYTAAAKHLSSMDVLSDLFQETDEISHENVESVAGPWWIHIGDDFGKDIIAAKSIKLRTIFARELLPEEKLEPMKTKADTNEEYSIRTQFADATVDSFSSIVSVLNDWNTEGNVSE